MRPNPLIFVAAGEASGDHYGAQLIASLRQVLPTAHFTGMGGVGMEAAGQRRIVRAEDVAFMGITEVLRHVPRVVGSYRLLVRAIRRERPSVAVLIDFPDVNFRLAKHCRALGIPVIWFVSPQLWAWKRKRLRWVQQRVSRMLTIFPFEEPFYRARGVDATFVGHPLAEAELPTISRKDYAQRAAQLEQWQQRQGDSLRLTHPRQARTLSTDPAPLSDTIDPGRQWVSLLPGSRQGEISANLPVLLQAAKLLGGNYEYLVPIAPGLTDAQLHRMQRMAATDLQVSPEIRVTFVHDARAALLHSRAAVVASGTATVQAAVLGTPFVTVYRVSDMTFRAAKRLVTYPPEVTASVDVYGNLPVAMPNLIAGWRVTPELLQNQFTPEGVVAALRPLLEDGPDREAAIDGLRRVRSSLLRPGEQTAIDRLRDTVLQELASVS